MNDYRSKLRSSPRRVPQDSTLLTNMAPDDFDFGYFPSFGDTPSPKKNRHAEMGFGSPHRSGSFPSPLRRLQNFLMSPTKSMQNELPGTPSPNKPSSATDLFGNKSLLDNLDVPDDWDENFLSNFQDDWLMGIGAEDLESLGKSPLKSPGRGQTFLPNNTKNASPIVSPFKSPLLTSSPKHSGTSPLWGKTPAPVGSRPVTRQRKLFLHSPEKQVPAQPSNTFNATVSWNAPLPFSSMLDASSSSALSDGLESTSSLHSISSYLKNLDEEDVQEDLPVMPPAGWTSRSGKISRTGKTGVKCSTKLKHKKPTPQIKQAEQQIYHRNVNVNAGCSQNIAGKKLKIEPQFTLLHPHTELRTHQISLRTTPVTPPNKVKISRDFSQIQTLPSKEQLRIVRNRFTETLNKAVEQVIEREKSKKKPSAVNTGSSPTPTPSVPTTSLQQSTSPYLTPGLSMPMPTSLPVPGLPQSAVAVKPPPSKRRKR